MTCKVDFAGLSSDDPAKWTKLFEKADIYSGFVYDTVACIVALTFLRNPKIRQATGTEVRSFSAAGRCVCGGEEGVELSGSTVPPHR